MRVRDSTEFKYGRDLLKLAKGCVFERCDTLVDCLMCKFSPVKLKANLLSFVVSHQSHR